MSLFLPRNRVKTKKKGFHLKVKSYSDRNQVKTKKKSSSPKFGTKFGRNQWDLLVLPGPFSSVQRTLDGGTRPPTI